MTTEKKNSEKRMLVSIHVTGRDLKSLEEFEAMCGTHACALLPSGHWEAHFIEAMASCGRLQAIHIPGAATLDVRIMGPVNEKRYWALDAELGQFHQDFIDNVHEPWLNHWAEQVARLGIEAGQDEWDRVQHYTHWLYNYFACTLSGLASTPVGSKKMKASGCKSIGQWFVNIVRSYILHDVRVTLGNADLTGAMAAKFAELVKEHFSVLLPCPMQ